MPGYTSQAMVGADRSRYNKQAILTSRTYGSPLVGRGQNDNNIFDIGDNNLQDRASSLLSSFYPYFIYVLIFLLSCPVPSCTAQSGLQTILVVALLSQACSIVVCAIGIFFLIKTAITSGEPLVTSDTGPLPRPTMASAQSRDRSSTSEKSHIKDEQLQDNAASITVSAADVALVARSRRAEVVGSGQDIGDLGGVSPEAIGADNKGTNRPITSPTHHSPPEHNFHIKDPTPLNKSVGYNRTEFSKKWTCGILSVLLSPFRTRGTRPTSSNKLSRAAQTAMKLPRTSRGLRGRGRFNLTTFLLDPMLCSPVVRRYQGRIRFILQLASPFFDTLGWELVSSDYFRSGYSDGSGQAPPSLGPDPFSWKGGGLWSDNDPNIELPTSNSLGLEEGLDTDDIPELPPGAAITSTLYDPSSFPIPEQINFPPTPPPPLDLNALYQRSYAGPHFEGVNCGDSLYGYPAYTTPIQHNSMENHGTSIQGHEPVSRSSLLAPSRQPLPEPGASNQPEPRLYAAVRSTNSPPINLPLQDIVVYSAHNHHQPHLSEAAVTANDDTSAADTIPEQLSFSFNPPTQPDLDPPNQQSFSSGFIAGFKFAMKLTATCTQANASPVRAESSKSSTHADRGVQSPSPPIAPVLGLDKANSLPSGRGSPAAAPSVSGEIGLQLYAPSASPPVTASPGPGPVSEILPSADTNPAANPRESRQELDPGSQNVGHDHNPTTSQAIQSIVLEDAPSTSTHQAPVSPPNPMHYMTNVLEPTAGPSSNSQGKARKSKKCPECDCAFRRPGELRDHIASRHRGEKQHACSFDGCDKTYGTRSNLAKHVKQKHTASAPTMPENNIG